MRRTTKDLRAAGRKYRAASRQLRYHLHRDGRAPLSLMRRLGETRGRYMAAITDREEREDAR